MYDITAKMTAATTETPLGAYISADLKARTAANEDITPPANGAITDMAGLGFVFVIL